MLVWFIAPSTATAVSGSPILKAFRNAGDWSIASTSTADQRPTKSQSPTPRGSGRRRSRARTGFTTGSPGPGSNAGSGTGARLCSILGPGHDRDNESARLKMLASGGTVGRHRKTHLRLVVVFQAESVDALIPARPAAFFSHDTVLVLHHDGPLTVPCARFQA